MDSTYTRILTAIDNQVPATKALAKRALMWIVCVGRPLRLEELVLAVAIELDIENTYDIKKYQGGAVIGACGNLITVENNIVGPVHYTVLEFLSASASFDSIATRTLVQEYQTFLPDGHMELAQYCIQYLLCKNHSATDRYGTFTLQYDNPLLNYCVFFWDYHLRGVPEWTVNLSDRFNAFLSCTRTLRTTHVIRAMRIFYMVDIDMEHMNALNFCLFHGLLDLFKRCHRFDRSIRDLPQYRMALHYSAQAGSVSAIQALLAIGFAVDSKDANDKTPLYYSCRQNHEEAAKIFLENGAEVNAEDRNDGNALYAAASGGHERVVALLLQNGAEVNTERGDNGTAFHAAAVRGHEKVMILLLDNGADVNAESRESGNPLRAAAERGHEKVVAFLLENGADVNANGGYNGTALQAACMGGEEVVVALLLENGADVNAEGGPYGTALQAAARQGHKSVVALLLQNGADVNAEGGFSGTALQEATMAAEEAVVALLLQNGANVNAQDGHCGTALQAAARRGNEGLVLLLLENGADVNAESEEYGTALQTATEGAHLSVAEILRNYGALESNTFESNRITIEQVRDYRTVRIINRE